MSEPIKVEITFADGSRLTTLEAAKEAVLAIKFGGAFISSQWKKEEQPSESRDMELRLQLLKEAAMKVAKEEVANLRKQFEQRVLQLSEEFRTTTADLIGQAWQGGAEAMRNEAVRYLEANDCGAFAERIARLPVPAASEE